MNNKYIKKAKSEKQITCSVCIATYKRPELLRKLIQSLFDQKEITDIFLEIIIVDNDKEKSANEIVGEFSDRSSITISYYEQPIQNISLTRNMAIDKSLGQYIMILDDDETADIYWIRNLLKTAIEFNADTVFGYVNAVFPENIPEWMKQREIYFKPMGKTGDKPIFWYTTNCLIKASFINKYNLRFDPRHGLSGGEDGFFFESLANKGAKFIVCREAITYEIIPEYRTTLKFIFSRFVQRGNNYGLNKIEIGNKRFQQARILLFIKATVAILFYGFQTIVLFFYKKKWIFSFIDLSSNLGKLSAIFGRKFYIYKSKHKLSEKK